MNILVITPGKLPIPPIYGGAVENLISYYIDENEEKKMYRYTVISSYEKDIRELKKRYSYSKFIYINKKKASFKIKQISKFILRKYLKVNIGNEYITQCMKSVNLKEYDLIILENSPGYVNTLRKYYNGKIYLHIHNDYLNKNNSNSKEIIEKFDKIIAVSNFLKKRILEVTNRTKVEVLYNTVNLEKFKNALMKTEIDSIKEKYNIAKDKIIIMYVGRIVAEKGILELINAFSKANLEKKMQLVIIGAAFFKNSEKNSFETKLKKITDKREDIVFTGFINYEEIGKIMSFADIGIVPSKINEAFGLALLEFMAAGIPTIITNRGALPEVAGENTSIIVDSESDLENNIFNAINKILNDKELASRLRINSKERAKNFSIEKYLNKYNEFIKEDT